MLYILLKGSWLVTLRHIPLQEGGGTLYCAWQDSSMLHTHQLHVAHKLVLNIAARSLVLVHSKISCYGSSFILTCTNFFYSVQLNLYKSTKWCKQAGAIYAGYLSLYAWSGGSLRITGAVDSALLKSDPPETNSRNFKSVWLIMCKCRAWRWSEH
jgi:hypothetical protein